MNDNHIGTLQNNSLEEVVITFTKSRGVDVIISEKNPNTHFFIRCLNAEGRLLEISSNNNLDIPPSVAARQKNISFYTISSDSIFDLNKTEKQHLTNLLKQSITYGIIQPFSTMIFKEDQVEQAFQYATRNCINKVLIQIRDENRINLSKAKTISS